MRKVERYRGKRKEERKSLRKKRNGKMIKRVNEVWGENKP